MSSSERPKKLQRISQACDLCHRRSIRCRPSVENAQKQCQNCYDFQVDCTYKRPSRRRRNQSVSHTSPPNLLPSQKIVPPDSAARENGESVVSAGTSNTAHGSSTPDFTGAFLTVREGRPEDLLGVAWRSFALASLSTIERLLEVYMDIIYPIYPLFHGPTLWRRIRNHEHLVDRGFFASVMGACALASARVRDGAAEGTRHHGYGGPEIQSEIFFSAASDAIFKDFAKSQGIGFLRACALLALTALQYGQIRTMHQYVGHYLTLSSMQHCHDENQWPADITVYDREERRRLFWSMYNLEIFISATFNSVMRSQEVQANVGYPSEVSDEDLTPGVPSPSNEENWLRGWNFTTDLYRVLEHTLKRARRNHQRREDRTSVVRLLVADAIPEMQVMENVLNLYYKLPPHFKDYSAMATGNVSRDIYGFQAANIQAALQLVRITVFSTDGHVTADVRSKCDIAEQVISTFRNICPSFLKAMSTPLFYALGTIGNILASAMESVLTEDLYGRVRALLVAMADLLQGLESGLHPTAGISREIRQQVDKIDQYMQAQRQLIASMPNNDAMMPTSMNPSMTSTTGMMSQGNAQGRSGMFTPMDEFQLPQDLVGEWPWPGSFIAQENAQPILSGFE